MDTRPVSALLKGHAFTRAVMALCRAEGAPLKAAQLCRDAWGPGARDSIAVCERWGDYTMKAPIGAGTAIDSQWAAPLAYQDNFAMQEFTDVLRSGTIIGKLNGLVRAPMNIRFPVATTGLGAGWIGDGGPIPVNKMQLTNASLGIAHMGNISVITTELARNSSPQAVALVQRSLIAGAVEFADHQFINPGVAAVTNVSPASITNGITALQSTGSTATQIAADLASVASTLADNNETDSLYWIVTRADAVRLAAKRDTAGGPAFPSISVNGGLLVGIPVVVSNAVPHSTSAGTVVVLVNASGIAVAEEPQIDAEVSGSATLEQDTAPTNNAATPTAATLINLFQTNSVAIKLVRYINWVRVRSTCVGFIDNCHY